MKKWMFISVVVLAAAWVQAASQTKAEYIAEVKEKAEKGGWEYISASTEAQFKKIDKDKDGVVTDSEKMAYWMKKARSKRQK